VAAMDSRVDQLERLLEHGKKFNFANFSIMDHTRSFGGEDTPEWLAWKQRVGNAVSELVDENSAPMRLLEEAWEIRTNGNDAQAFQIQKSFFILALEQSIQIAGDDIFAELKKLKGMSGSAAISNRIFVVHGHDEKMKMELEIFLNNIGLEPVVLHREADKGRTLIEKFEKNTDVGSALSS
jgi:hypothetical protein